MFTGPPDRSDPMPETCNDPILVDDWHVVADLSALPLGASLGTRLLGVPVKLARMPSGAVIARSGERVLPVRMAHGFVWTSLGTPSRDIPDIPELHDTDRFIVTGGSFGVRVSGLRAVENFLDMGHFPFVHAGWLGAEPRTEVAPYRAEITRDDEILATDCRFYQPVASPNARGGMMVDYVYRVLRPFTVCLYKSNPAVPGRMDVIFLFVQPVDSETCIAHPLLCYLREGMTEATLRWFMQLVFAQDKPILENQLPRRLPLDPRAETPIRADAASILYRRWLAEKNVRYGAIPANTQNREAIR